MTSKVLTFEGRLLNPIMFIYVLLTLVPFLWLGSAQTGPISPPYNVHACEGRHLSLECPIGSYIKINSTMYGRQTRRICPLNLITSFCKAKGSDAKVKKLCDGKQNCSVIASNTVFGDPCRLQRKYLAVNYRCIRPVHEIKVCENLYKEIKCQLGMKLRIIDANYGRLNSVDCPFMNHVGNTACRSENSLSETKKRCDEMQSCKLKAYNKIYGDPCKFISKYLHVKYICVW